jgi:cyclophilin family peptidyl-prolyl cis-trans isomerase
MKKLLLLSILFISMSELAFSQKTNTIKKKVPVKKSKVATPVKPIRLPGTRVKITTDSGIVVIRLYDKTPLHRDNFIKLVKEGFYDSLLFHRVIKDFMIQGGDPASKNAAPGIQLGNGGTGYTIPAEFDTTLFHKKGALSAARLGDDINPQKESSGCQFYLVQGKKYNDETLNQMEAHFGRKFTAKARKLYKTIGGTPFLDMNYTVFGEVETGLKVIDKIAGVLKDPSDRPLTDIRMKMEIVE